MINSDGGTKGLVKRFGAIFRDASLPGFQIQSKTSEFVHTRRQKKGSRGHEKPNCHNNEIYHDTNGKETNNRQNNAALQPILRQHIDGSELQRPIKPGIDPVRALSR